MFGGHRALEWLARRHAGESVAYIAAHEGVSKAEVLQATRPFGPFPRATRQLGRVTGSSERVTERTQRWIEERRAGRTTADIAREHGVSRQLVGAATSEFGPFPSMDQVEAWVEARRSRRTIQAIADEFGVPQSMVRRHTRSFGPFPQPSSYLPEGVWGVGAVARRVGMPTPTVMAWRDRGMLPKPDFVTASGRVLWLPATIECWLRDTTELAECPDCGAFCRSVGHHRSAKHPESWAASQQ